MIMDCKGKAGGVGAYRIKHQTVRTVYIPRNLLFFADRCPLDIVVFAHSVNKLAVLKIETLIFTNFHFLSTIYAVLHTVIFFTDFVQRCFGLCEEGPCQSPLGIPCRDLLLRGQYGGSLFIRLFKKRPSCETIHLIQLCRI
jgi:hypothetical protein